MAAAYKVVLPAGSAQTLVKEANGLIIYADSGTEAIIAAKSYFSSAPPAMWAGATATAIAAGADLEGWRLRVLVDNVTTGVDLYDVTVTGAAAATVDSIAALMVTALEAAGGADLTPSYDSDTNVLTVAAIADDIGDHRLTVQFLPPIATYGRPDYAFPSFVSTIVDEGIAGAVLTVLLVQSTIPSVSAAVEIK